MAISRMGLSRMSCPHEDSLAAHGIPTFTGPEALLYYHAYILRERS